MVEAAEDVVSKLGREETVVEVAEDVAIKLG